MKRWHEEVNLMLRRWRQEIKKHTTREGRIVQGCCLQGKGFMRKRRPYGKCAPSQGCNCCDAMRAQVRQEKRRERYAGRMGCREVFG
jgi:hypothetical protein